MTLKSIALRWFSFLIWIALLAFGLNTGLGFWAMKRLEKKAGSSFQGTFIPHFLRPAFTLKNPQLVWQDRFQLVSGDLSVQYDPLSLFGRKLRVQVKGSDLNVRLFGDLIKSQGLSEAEVEKVEADFAFSDHGPPEIFLFNLRSPQLHFNLMEKSSNPS